MAMPKKQKTITPAMTEKYADDIILFLEEQYILPNGKFIILEKWQKKILRSVFGKSKRRHPELRQYRLALLMYCKKNGKSSLAAGIGIWALLFDRQDDYEVFITAGDMDQAKIIYRMIKNAIKKNPALLELVNIKLNDIERKDDKGFLRVVSSDASGAHGVNPSMVIFDELWNQTSEDLFSALTLSPTKQNGMQLIISYAGYDKDSLLYRLYERGKKGDDKKMFFFHTHKNLASWVDREYLADQKSLLAPFEYARMHECRWTDAKNAFIDSKQIDNCVDETLLPTLKGNPAFTYFAGLDVGLKFDKTVATICHYDFSLNAVVLDEIISWQGSKTDPVDLKSIEDHFLDAHQRYNLNRIICDPWQAMQLIQNLKAKRLPIEEYNFSAQNVNRLATNLFFLFSNRRIKIFYHQQLINELKTVQAIQTSYGYRIDHKSGKHDDFVISLGLASLFAVQNQKPKSMPEVWFAGNSDDEDDDDF